MEEEGFVFSFELWCSDTMLRNIESCFNGNFPHFLLIVESLIYIEYMLKVRNYNKLNIEGFTVVC